LPNDESRDSFAADYTYLGKHWEVISLTRCLSNTKPSIDGLTQVYESIRPTVEGENSFGTLGEKTLKLIHDNVTVQAIRDDLDTLVMDEKILDQMSGGTKRKAKEVELKIVWRLLSTPMTPIHGARGRSLRNSKTNTIETQSLALGSSRSF